MDIRSGSRLEVASDPSVAVELLSGSPDFVGAARASLEGLAAGMVKRRYPVRSVIIQEGDDSGPAYLIESGRVWLTRSGPEGDQSWLAELGPGSVVGEMTALTGLPRAATATALSEVIAWKIPTTLLRRALLSDVGLTYQMMLSTMELVLSKDMHTILRAKQGGLERVASQLLELSPAGSQDGETTISLTHGELAMMSGLTRESVTRALSQLRRRAIISSGRGEIVVLDRAGLERSAGARRNL